MSGGRAGELAGAILALPAAERTVLALEYLEQLGPAEIAAVLGIDETEVLAARARALAALRGVRHR